MMKILTQNKTLIVVIIILGLAIFGYNYLRSSGIIVVDVAPAQIVGSDLLELSSQIKSATLDTSVFDSALYQSLTDFSIILVPQPTGRPNPFALIGS